MNTTFDPHCRQCSRLSRFLDDVKLKHPTYHARPVEPFGARKAQLLIVGLAPGMHGANATGRPFTGDYAGILLYETLYKFAFSNQATSEHSGDKLKLKHCRITNAVKCLPPENKPEGKEINQCNTFLAAELAELPKPAVILALGTIAHNAVLKASGVKQTACKFSHGAVHRLTEYRILVDSYHCSRYNTQTKRLTENMFHDVFRKITKLLKQ